MSHRLQDIVSFELAQRAASGLPDHPEWLALAFDKLHRWKRLNTSAAGLMRCNTEWEAILALPLGDVVRILLDHSDEGQRLRQNSPFVGVLIPAQVWEIKRQAREAFAISHPPATS